MIADEVIWEFYFDEVHERSNECYDPYEYICENDMADYPTEEELEKFDWEEG